MTTPAMRIAAEGERPLTKRVSLTKTLIENTHCPANARVAVIYDNAVRGLCIHVTKSTKSFYVYRKANGRPMRFKIGSFPEMSVEIARKSAMQQLGQIVQGIDPREERRAIRQSITLQELFDRWQRDHAKPRHTLRTLRTDKSRFDTCFEDWKTRKLATIREHHVRELHSLIAANRGQVTANRAVQLLRRLYNFARISPNPAGNKAVNFFPEKERDRFLQPDELAQFFAAAAAELNPMFQDFFELCLWTGQRRDNVGSMAWAEVDLKAKVWTIPATKTKNKEPQLVPLTTPAIEILARRLADAEKNVANGDERYGVYVFPSKRFDAKTPYLTEPKGAWKRLLNRAKLTDLRIHDLRRSLGSWAAITGASLPIVGKMLGHLDPSATKIYARLHLDPVRASIETATAAIQAAANPSKPTRNPRKRTETPRELQDAIGATLR